MKKLGYKHKCIEKQWNSNDSVTQTEGKCHAFSCLAYVEKTTCVPGWVPTQKKKTRITEAKLIKKKTI